MKNLFALLLVLFVLGLFITSCEKEEEEVSPIVGTWVLSKVSYRECTDPNENSEGPMECSDDFCYTYVFDSNGGLKFIEVESGVETIYEGTYTIKEGKMTFCGTEDGNEYCEEFDVAISGSTMTFTFDDESDWCLQVNTYEKQ